MTVLSCDGEQREQKKSREEGEQVFIASQKTSNNKESIHICGWFGAFCGKYNVWLQQRW